MWIIWFQIQPAVPGGKTRRPNTKVKKKRLARGRAQVSYRLCYVMEFNTFPTASK